MLREQVSKTDFRYYGKQLFSLISLSPARDIWSEKDFICPDVNFTEDQKAVLSLLEGEDALHIDRLTVALNAHPGQLQETVLTLQIKGMIEALPGSFYRINSQDQGVTSH